MDDIALASRSTARLSEMKNDTVPRAITIHEEHDSGYVDKRIVQGLIHQITQDGWIGVISYEPLSGSE